MEFMDMLREWLDLRDRQNAEEDNRPIDTRYREQDRMAELEDEINRRALATDPVRQALTDLVALKDLKDAFTAEIAHAAKMGGVPSVKCARAKRIYEREQPLAWAKARAALAGG